MYWAGDGRHNTENGTVYRSVVANRWPHPSHTSRTLDDKIAIVRNTLTNPTLISLHSIYHNTHGVHNMIHLPISWEKNFV